MSETASFYRNQNRKIVDYPISEDRKTQFWRQKTLAIDVLTFRKDNKTEAFYFTVVTTVETVSHWRNVGDLILFYGNDNGKSSVSLAKHQQI